MGRVIAVANGKGGVGKTSITAGLAGLAAAAGYRVLAVGMDPQGDLCRDFGREMDDGSNLAAAIQGLVELEPVRDVRPGLDFVPGGQALDGLTAVWLMQQAKRRSARTDALRTALDTVRPQDGDFYDLVLVDTPPGEPVLHEIVLASSDYVIIPTRSDESSIDGLVTLAERFAAARQTNPGLTLLGVVLFGVRKQSTRIAAAVREALADTLGAAAPVFDTTVRYLESAAVDMRSNGLLPHELGDAQAKAARERIAQLREGKVAAGGLYSRDSTGLAGDYEALVREVLTAVADREKDEQAAGAGR